MISPTCGSWIGARDLPGDTPRMRGHRPAGGLLGAAACVRAAVEPSARGALVDLPRPLRDRLAQPGGVAAGVLHLVGVRRPVDAAVGQPAGRQPGPAPAAELARPLAAGGGVARAPARGRRPRRAARAVRRGRSRSPARARRRATPRPAHVGAASRAVAFAGGRPLPRLRRILRARQLRRQPVAGRALRRSRRYSRAASSSRSSSPSGIHTTLAYRSSSAARSSSPSTARHTSPERVERGRLDDPVVGAGLQVDGRAGGEVARQRLARNGRELEHLLGEGGQDHVRDSRLQRPADEPAAQRVGRELADAVGLHPRLFEQPPVDRELPVGGVV